LPAKVRQAERRCPREREGPWSMVGSHPMATDRYKAVTSGTFICRSRGGSRGTGWLKSADKDEVPG
jgi:hypothetical protein